MFNSYLTYVGLISYIPQENFSDDRNTNLQLQQPSKLPRQSIRLILYLLEPRHSTGFGLDVLNQSWYQLVRPLAPWALELVIVMGWGTEVHVQRGESTERAMTEVAFIC